MSEILITNLPNINNASGPIESVYLTWDERCKPRQRAQTDKGTGVAIALERGTVLGDGVILFNEQERTIIVRAKPQPVLVIKPADTQEVCLVSHHLGNWHRSLELRGNEILTEPDEPLADWLRRNSIAFAEQELPYTPNLRTHAHD